MVTNIKGDLLSSDCVIRCHQVNCRGVMGAGLAKQVKEKYPEAFDPYGNLCKTLGSKLLGEVQFIACHDGTIIANMFAQDGYDAKGVQTDMTALEECLDRLQIFAAKTGLKVGFPKNLGAGLAGGDWGKIEALINTYFGTAVADCIIVELDGGASTTGEKATESVTAGEGTAEPATAGEGTAKPATAGEAAPNLPATAPKPEKKKKKKVQVTIYTDGACSGNPGPGGWAAILTADGIDNKEMSGGEKDTTNNRMELTAVIKALEALRMPCEVKLYSDSTYVVNSITKGWMAGWKKAGWTKKGGLPNTDLWKQVDELLQKHNVTFFWVKGHADNPMNNRCDELAQAASRRA